MLGLPHTCSLDDMVQIKGLLRNNTQDSPGHNTSHLSEASAAYNPATGWSRRPDLQSTGHEWPVFLN